MRSLLWLIALTLLLAACGGDETTTDPGGAAEPPTPTPAREVATAAPQVSADSEPTATAGADEVEADVTEVLYPDVVAAEARPSGVDTWSFDVTLSSPYDSPDRYADAWRVLAPDGTELGIRILTHHHAGEQPFTRSLSGVEVPSDVDTVTIQGRDQQSGWGGTTLDLPLPR